MEISTATWNFVVSLAAVINGLGIVRLVGGFGDFLKKRKSLTVNHYWVYSVMALFQLLAHILLWWSIVGLQSAGNLNFLSYLYLLLGPTLMFLATTMLLPTMGDEIDLEAEYYEFRATYFTVLALFWVWVLCFWPAFGYDISPNWPQQIVWLAMAMIMALSANRTVHAILAPAHLFWFAVMVGRTAMELGTMAQSVSGQ